MAQTEEQTTVVTRDTPLDPSAIMQLATGYWASAALLTANELGFFAAVADGFHTAREVADKVGVSARGAAMLLDACCGLNLLAKQGDRYLLPSVSEAFLVPGRPGYLGHALQWARDQWAAWGSLTDAVRFGVPLAGYDRHLGGDPDATRTFVLAMHERALGVARAVVRHLDLEGCHTMLDVGGGPGTYAMLLAQHYPEIQITVLDLPPVVAVARELIAKAGLSGRVVAAEADAAFPDYGHDRYDAVLFSGVLHQMDESGVRTMLIAGRDALVPGGRLLVSDIMTDATHTQPVFATLFSLQMMLSSQAGGVFAVEECAAWMESAGLVDVEIQRLPDPLPYTVLTGRR